MRKAAAAFVMTLVPGIAVAQGTAEPGLMQYVFVAPGMVVEYGANPIMHVGGGLDAVLRKGIGLSLEAGYLVAFGPDVGSGAGVFSGNIVFHTDPPRPRRFTPFLTGGYSVFVAHGAGHFVNVGGGGTYWLTPRAGLRLEIRTHTPAEGFFTAHAWGARIGFTQAL